MKNLGNAYFINSSPCYNLVLEKVKQFKQSNAIGSGYEIFKNQLNRH